MVCALREAIRSYRRDQGVGQDWAMEIPLTSERIRMACQDDIVSHVRENVIADQENILNIIK